MKLKQMILFSVALIMISQAVSAEFKIARNSSFIDTSYLEGDYVRGSLNMNFTRQENIAWASNFKGGIKLLDLLNAMNYSTQDFGCQPQNCGSDYSVISSTIATEPEVDMSEKQLFGMRLTDTKQLKEIKEFHFGVFIDAQSSCENQLYIDLFNDGTVDFYNKNADSESRTCPEELFPERGKNYGCFDYEEVTGEAVIENTQYYCQFIDDILPAPAYKIGGNILKKGTGEERLQFVLFSADGGEPLAFPEVIAPSSGVVEATANYGSAKAFDAYVCVWAPEGDGVYTINISDDAEEFCGRSIEINGDFAGNFTTNFPLFIQPVGYAPLNDFTFEKNLYEEITEQDLVDDIEEYFLAKYNNNCSLGCILPFSIYGKEDIENVFLHGAELRGTFGTGISQTNGNIYQLTEKPAEITSKRPLILDVEKMKFKVPDTNGKQVFSLRLGNEEVIKENVYVSIGFDFNVLPRFSLIGRSTAFTAYTGQNVSYSTWNFGDGSAPVRVSGVSTTHTFSNDGEYSVVVTLSKRTNTNATETNSTKRFKIIVGDAKTSANITLKEYEGRLAKIRTEINALPNWTRGSIEEVLNLALISQTVATKKNEFETKVRAANTQEQEYVTILNELLAFDVPYAIITRKSGSLPAEVGYSSFNVAHIESISNKQVVNKEEARGKILTWMEKNYETNLDFQTIAKQDDAGTTDIATVYTIRASKETGATDVPTYLVIGYPKSQIVFRSAAETHDASSGSAAYISFSGDNPPQTTEFLIKGSAAPEVQALGIYISPVIDQLGLNDLPISDCLWNCDEGGQFNWRRFIIGMIILIVITLGAYLFLQAWYKRNYEKHLFPNSNDLYNIINFIYNSRKSGASDEATRQKLKDKKWNNEQIGYAFKKINGKRTGMWEIPLFKFVENKKVRREIEKKQGGPIDIRFIKRPGV